MSTDTDRLLKNARIRLPGATDESLYLEMFNVLNEFFQYSNVWKEKIDFPVLASDPAGTAYTIAPSNPATTIHRLGYVVSSANITVTAGMEIPGQVTLAVPPTQSDTYTAHVVLTVNDPVTDGFPTFPAWVMHKYYMGLMDGLLGRMMSQPAKPFTNLQLGAYHQRKFKNMISFAVSESLRKNTSNTQAWRFPRSFA